jgi:flagellar biosynthesis protein FliR
MRKSTLPPFVLAGALIGIAAQFVVEAITGEPVVRYIDLGPFMRVWGITNPEAGAAAITGLVGLLLGCVAQLIFNAVRARKA